MAKKLVCHAAYIRFNESETTKSGNFCTIAGLPPSRYKKNQSVAKTFASKSLFSFWRTAMTDTNTLTQKDFLARAETDLTQGLAAHNLDAFNADVNKMREQVPAGQYGTWIRSLNNDLEQKNILPSTTTIIGTDTTGKNLVVADDNTKSAVVFSPAGSPLSRMSESQAAAPIDQNMVKVSALSQKDGQFSILLPPGLDTSGSGKFAVQDYKDNTVTNKDGSITHNVSGQLNDGSWGINIHAYESEDPAKFTGSYTTTSDGKLLQSHITYDSKGNETILAGGYVSSFPFQEPNPTTPYRELNTTAVSSSVDTYYSPAKGAYMTTMKNKNENDWAPNYETVGTNGKTQSTAAGALYTGTVWPNGSSVQRDVAGNVSAITYPKNGGDNAPTATITRDSQENVIGVKQADSSVWSKVGANQWKVTKNNGSQVLSGNLVVENNGDIAFTDSKTHDTTITPVVSGSFSGDTQVVNAAGQVIKTDNDNGNYENTYQYSSTGKLTSEKTTQIDGSETKTTIDTNGVAAAPLPIVFFADK
jgi:hypothetical protein